MRSDLAKLLVDLRDLEALIKSPAIDHFKSHENPSVKDYFRTWRRYEHVTFYLALYAAFETFVKRLVAESIHLESKYVEYSKLPKKLQDRHLNWIARILMKNTVRTGRYRDIEYRTEIASLHECLSGSARYRVSQNFLYDQENNLWPTTLNEVLATVGIENASQDLNNARDMLKWYSEQTTEPGWDRVPDRVIHERLGSLVEIRNGIAHGSYRGDEIPSLEDMLSALSFIKALSSSIYVMIVARYLGTRYRERSGESVTLKLSSDRVQGGQVVLVRSASAALYIGQPIFVHSTNQASWGRIGGLRLKDKEVSEASPSAIQAADGVGISLKGFRYRPRKNTELIALKGEDDLVWEPLAPAR